VFRLLYRVSYRTTRCKEWYAVRIWKRKANLSPLPPKNMSRHTEYNIPTIFMCEGCVRAVPYTRRLVSNMSLRRSGFDPISAHVRFIVDKVALGQIFCKFFGFPLSISIHRGSPHSYIILGMNNRPVGDRSSETSSHLMDMNNNGVCVSG
jgi:hypothetical protein